MASFNLTIGGEFAESLHGINESQALTNLWNKYRCDHGPMSGEKPASLADLIDRMCDAYAKDCQIEVEA